MEDDEATRFLFRMIVEESNPRVDLFVAANYREATAFLHAGPPFDYAPLPDVIIVDLNLPGKDGFFVLEEIRRLECYAGRPVIVFTSSMLCSDQEKAFSRGATEYIRKPLEFQQFKEAVQYFCSLLP